MTVELNDVEINEVVTVLFERISGFWETLKEDCESMGQAAAMYDSDPAVTVLRKLVPNRLATHRLETLQEVSIYLE